MKTIAFFNNKGGVGKTSLVYHVAWMLAEKKIKTLLIDLDPQANLTIMCLDTEELADVWNMRPQDTVYGALRTFFADVGDVSEPNAVQMNQWLHLILGDFALSEIEDELSIQWSRCLAGDFRPLRATSCFDLIIQSVGRKLEIDVALVDVGPNLGAINRSALIACDFVVIPLLADFFTVRSLRDVGAKLRTWRSGWQERRHRKPAELSFELPEGAMAPIGYVVSRQSLFAGHPPASSKRWLDMVPSAYREAVENQPLPPGITIDNDDRKLALLKDYRSLMPMAQEARKPMFALKPADGAIGGHQRAVLDCYADFKALTETLLERIDEPVPGRP